MQYQGKIIGFFVGLWIGGPFLAMIGLLAGHYFDLQASGYYKHPDRRYTRDSYGRRQYSAENSAYNQQRAQQAFFRATFLTMGHIAKAEGRVQEQDIRVANIIMRNMFLNQALKREAMLLFNQGKQPNFNLDVTIRELMNATAASVDLLRMFVDIQFQAAAASGSISPRKREILQRICDLIGINSSEFYIFSQRHQRHYHTGGQGQGQGQGQRQGYSSRQQTRTRTTTLDDYYQILGVKPGISDIDLKKAYRKKISQNHPDKLVAKGLPEEMIKMANKKTAEIKKAYDTIMESRGVR